MTNRKQNRYLSRKYLTKRNAREFSRREKSSEFRAKPKTAYTYTGPINIMPNDSICNIVVNVEKRISFKSLRKQIQASCKEQWLDCIDNNNLVVVPALRMMGLRAQNGKTPKLLVPGDKLILTIEIRHTDDRPVEKHLSSKTQKKRDRSESGSIARYRKIQDDIWLKDEIEEFHSQDMAQKAQNEKAIDLSSLLEIWELCHDE